MLIRILVIAVVCVAIYFTIALVLIASQRPGAVAGEGGLDFSGIAGRSAAEPAVLIDYTARDGTTLHYRSYASGRDAAPLMVFLHGSGWHGLMYDPLARRIAESGAADVLLPDLRGHGANPARRGDIDYIGQFEDDIADLIQIERKDGQPVVIAGHSSGGGLAIRYAGGEYGEELASAVLLAPYLHYKAPTMRENSGGWAHPLTRRIIGLTMLNNAHVTALNHLTAIQFSFPPAVLEGPLGDTATDRYSYRLNTSYAPRNDYKDDIAALPPFLLVAGRDDEAFDAARFEEAMGAVNGGGEYRLLEGVGHLDVALSAEAADAVIAYLVALR